MSVTPEMRTTFALFRAMGLGFHVTGERTLDCGCVLYLGWDTKDEVPSWRFRPHSPSHMVVAERVRDRWLDPDVLARLGSTEAADSFCVLFAEEIGGGA